jgi:hypothetical protein
MVDEWHITERAASNMRDLNKMVRYLRARSALTETLRARGVSGSLGAGGVDG